MKKILVVDDSASIRNILKLALFETYDVLEAENGKDALGKSKDAGISLFLLDVNMPVMDGISLVKELRGTSEYRSTPIIMLTTESRDDWKKKGKEAGANGWIVKPCEPENLLSIILRMLS
ncbi:MAG: response regulator [Spirochaetales bacterium]|nr:response regulator [Spirochaetales bacterium]